MYTITRASKRKRRGTPTPEINAKRVKKKKRLAGYNPLWVLRTRNILTFTNKKGRIVTVKTGVVIDRDQIKLNNPALMPTLEALYEESLKTIESNRPIIITEWSENGSPLKGYTPSRKTIMYRHTTSQLVTFMTNIPSESSISSPTEQQIRKDFFKSEEYKAAPVADTPIKKQQYTIHANSRHHTGRKITQNSIMGNVSAEQYARAAGLPARENKEIRQKREWGHVGSFDVLGPDSQNSSNLYVSENPLNSRIITKDEGARILASNFGKVEVKVEVPLVSKTHIATHVVQHMSTKDVTLRFTSKNSSETVHTVERRYDINFFKSLGEAHKPSEIKTPPQAPTASTKGVFFSRKKLVMS